MVRVWSMCLPRPLQGQLKVLLLHGNLDIWIKEAKNHPNMDSFHKGLGDMFGKLYVKLAVSLMETRLTS